MLVFLLACSTSEHRDLAGFTEFATAFSPNGDLMYIQARTYDDTGRMVSSRYESSSILLEESTVYEGDCPVNGVRVSTNETGAETYDTTTTCDAQDAPTFSRSIGVITSNTGMELEYFSWEQRYANKHDDQGRLIEVVRENGEFHTTYTQVWGECQSPTFTGYANLNADFGESRLQCDSEGRRTEIMSTAFDSDGVPWDTTRTRFAYDTLGRLVSTLRDDGEGTKLQAEYALIWGDVTAPGPTSETLHEDGELTHSWEFSYEKARQ